MGIPEALTWDLVLTDVAAFLGNSLVQAGVVASIAIAFGPRVMRALFRAIRAR